MFCSLWIHAVYVMLYQFIYLYEINQSLCQRQMLYDYLSTTINNEMYNLYRHIYLTLWECYSSLRCLNSEFNVKLQ